MLEKIENRCFYFLSVIRSILFNFRHLSFKQAKALPILIDWRVRTNIKGRILLSDRGSSRFNIIIGREGSHHISSQETILVIDSGGLLTLGNNILLSSGFSLKIENGGSVFLDDGVSFNRNGSIHCQEAITIGKDCLFGWGCSIRDTDGHRIFINDEEQLITSPVIISDNVWVAAESSILKAVTIGKGSVVATRSLVNKQFPENNQLIAGVPATVKKKNICWEK
ncbi:acyltransferase [Streptococcus suis]|uniref:acyltransferase n=1 Tax=Streptococcus suis TaxID=1307 RepID=UPI001ABE909D|nr:acyltransferase [Streptococcus suis]